MIAAILLGVGLLLLTIPQTAGTAGAVQPSPPQPVKLTDEQVLVGVYVENIQTIDPQNNSFTADMYMWYRWTDADLKPYESVEIKNLFEAWMMTEVSAQDKPIKQSDGSYYYGVRYSGSFNSALSLVQFPFGTQSLTVVLEDFSSKVADLQFVADERSTDINTSITIPSYDIGRPTIQVSEFTYTTDFGDVDGAANETYSRATVAIPVSNPGLPSVFKYLVPIALVVIAAGLVFQIPPDAVEGRIALGITALLTGVAMQWSATEGLPTIAYLTMLDVLYLVAIVFILASLILGLRSSWKVRDSSEEAVIRADERTFILYLLAFAAAFSTVLVLYLM